MLHSSLIETWTPVVFNRSQSLAREWHSSYIYSFSYSFHRQLWEGNVFAGHCDGGYGYKALFMESTENTLKVWKTWPTFNSCPEKNIYHWETKIIDEHENNKHIAIHIENST